MCTKIAYPPNPFTSITYLAFIAKNKASYKKGIHIIMNQSRVLRKTPTPLPSTQTPHPQIPHPNPPADIQRQDRTRQEDKTRGQDSTREANTRHPSIQPTGSLNPYKGHQNKFI